MTLTNRWEAATNIININEFDSGTIKRIIQFIYKKDYDNSGEEQGSNIAHIETLNQGKGYIYTLIQFIYT